MTQKATVAKVNLGFTQVEGLHLKKGEYAIAVPQVADLFQTSRNTASKDYRRMLGADFQTSKHVTEFNTNPVNVIDLQLVARIAVELMKKGNKLAESYVLAAVTESIERRFDRAFDKKRSEEEYNARLTARMQGKEARWDLTNAIKAYIDQHQLTGNQAKFLYMHATNALYCTLTGEPSMHAIKLKYNIPINDTLRNYLSDRDLKHIEYIESLAQRLIDIDDIHPVNAVTQATNSLKLGSVGIQRVARI
jgi:hypothetical protein